MTPPADKQAALRVVHGLRDAGFQAMFAGGCVRDMLLGRPCSDYDVATDARPEQVARLFRRVLLVGAKFGVAMVMQGKRKVEVATFRSDLAYVDGRRPEAVVFSSAPEDAQRRDFTINGMFYDPIDEEVIDYVGGREDLQTGLVRTIGDADARFSEDYLRMLRAVRFAHRLGFEIATDTERAIAAHAGKIVEISGERVFEELSKMLVHPSASAAMADLDRLGLGPHVLPELYERTGVTDAAIERVSAVADQGDLTLAMAALLCDVPAEAVARRFRRWGAGNELRDAVTWLIRQADDWRTAADEPLHAFKRRMASEEFGRLMDLWRARETEVTGESARTLEARRRAESISPEQIAPEPLVTGADLLEMGVEPGPAFGALLGELYDAQLDGELSDRNEALDAARRRVSRTAGD